MNAITPFQTQVAANSTGVTGATQALQGSGSGVLSTGVNFFDMIIANLVAAEEGKATPAMDTNASGVTNAATDGTQQQAPSFVKPAVLKNDNPLAALQVALAAQTVDADGNIVVTAATPEGTVPLQKQLDVTNQIINHLKNMLPENAQQEGVFNKILAKLQTKSESLQTSLSALESGVITKDTPVENIPEPLLIALGLSPAQINEATQKIQDLEKKLGRDITVEDLIAGVGGIVPPAPEQAVVANVQMGSKTVIDTATDEAAEPSDDLAAQLNALDVGGGEVPEEFHAKRDIKGLPVTDDETGEDAAPVTDAKDAPSLKGEKADVTVKKDVTTFRENLVNLMNTNNKPQTDTNLTFPATMFSSDTDAAIYAQYGLSPTMSTSLGSTAQAANLVSSATVAGQNHPATQLVAATITKSAANGGDQTMSIRLDPPELGNVNVRLQFGKDKAVKAHIMVEKPETYMMLQRDSHALERALQSAGLDTTATDAISFELAQDNGTFNPNDGDQANAGGKGGSNGAGSDSGAEDIIQSSVTWQVDPSSGHVRYNIFA